MADTECDEGFVAVSYTHLDVYKRQKLDELKESNKKQTESLENKLELQSENFRQDTIKITESLEELKIDNIEIKQSIIDSNAPVSYTHLDVYKRQA